MKMKHTFLAVAATSLLGVVLFASQPVRPPDRSRIVGVWSGDSTHLDFLRLELDDDGTGFLYIGYNSSREKARLYRVETWQYADWKVELTTKPIDADAEPVYFTNFVAGYQEAECEFGGIGDERWKRKANLICESE